MADTSIFADTNIFIRFLTGDHPRMTADCRRLLERAEGGEFELHTSQLVIAEIVWTLRSQYRIPRPEVAAMVHDLLALRSLRVDQKEMLRAAVDLYGSTNVDFIDAYNAVEVTRRGMDRIVSYDHDFDTLRVGRVEPADV